MLRFIKQFVKNGEKLEAFAYLKTFFSSCQKIKARVCVHKLKKNADEEFPNSAQKVSWNSFIAVFSRFLGVS